MSHALYQRSVIMIMIGGILLSLLGIGVRIMDNPDSLIILFYRGIAQSFFLIFVVIWLHRGKTVSQFTSMGRKGFAAAVLIAASGLFIVSSIAYTTVANAFFIVSLAPLCTALLAKVFLSETVSQRTWIAMTIALVGIVIIFGDGLSTGGLFGMFLASLMMLCYSASIIVIRSQTATDSQAPTANIFAVCALSSVILFLSVIPFINDFSVSTKDLMICLFLGVFQIGLGLVLIISSARYVPSAQVALLALLEVILSPIWVWIGVGEEPSFYTLVGGAVVLIAVVLQAFASVDSNKDQQSNPA